MKLVSARHLGHEAVDAEDQRHAGDRDRGDDREGRGEGDEAGAGDAGGALGGEHRDEQQEDLVAESERSMLQAWAMNRAASVM